MSIATADFAAKSAHAARVVVVDLGFLGDAVHLLPALWTLRSHYPNAQLDLISTPSACELVSLTQCVNRCWPIELRRESRSLSAQFATVRAIRRTRYDVAINLTAADRSIILTRLTGAPWRLGLLGGRQHFWNGWLIPAWIPPSDPELPVYEQLCQGLARAGFTPGPTRFALQVPGSERVWAEESLPPRVIHFSLCAASALKEWPVRHFASLAASLLQRYPGMTIAVSASPREREQARLNEFVRLVPALPIVRLPSKLSIAQLAAALQRCKLHVGPDSGVIHVAMALQVPTISIFRQRGTGWKGWIPRGPKHHAFLQVCSCSHDHQAPCAASNIPQCLEALPPSDVLKVCQKILDSDHNLALGV